MWECKKCKYLESDETVGYYECENELITESELDKHFSDGKDSCPHFQYRKEALPPYYN